MVCGFLLAVGTGADLIDNGLLEIDKDYLQLTRQRKDKARQKRLRMDEGIGTIVDTK